MIAKELLDYDLIEDSKLQLGDNFSTIVRYFFEDSIGYLEEIKKAITTDKPINAVAAAHTLKSSSLIIGAVRVSALAKQLEQVARESASIAEGAQKLQPLYEQLESAIADTKVKLLT